MLDSKMNLKIFRQNAEFMRRFTDISDEIWQIALRILNWDQKIIGSVGSFSELVRSRYYGRMGIRLWRWLNSR